MSSKRGERLVTISGGPVTESQSLPVVAELFLQGQRMTRASRGELKAKLRAGELDEIIFEAVVYRDGPNGNHVRFREADLSGLAASYAGVPFLRNHDTHDVGSRDGTVVEGRLVNGEFQQTVRLTTERGMRDFLDGVIDRFSISWYFQGVECGICGQDWFGCSHWPGERYEGRVCELMFVGPRGKETSAVNAPAVQGTRILEQLCQLKESSGMEEGTILLPDGSVKVVEPLAGSPRGASAAQLPAAAEQGNGGLVDEVRALRAQIDAERVEQMIAGSRLSEEGKAVVRLAAAGKDVAFAAQLIEAQRKADGARVEGSLVRGIRPVITEGMMMTGGDRVQSALSWIFGVRDEALPVPSMRSIRDLYQVVTGDHDWRGIFNPEWSQLSAASTSTLAGMVVNALNKVVKMHYDNMATYRWYERIVDVAPHDGTTNDVQLIMVDGLANLPTVGEGAAYTEAVVGDSKESFSFTKRGHYVGITLEAIRRSDIQKIQAIPRAMVQGSIRARSAAIAGIFTTASGVGPTLADDSLALFHATHANLATVAFSSAEWAAARTRIWEQTVPGTSKPLGLWPTFVLVPIELYDSALTEFGYGNGDVGKPSAAGTAQTVNPYGESRIGDPRPVPVPVPDWTDSNDWAYMVDPRLHPVIHMAYANAPQGGAHPMPEIFEVASETSGLMFTNDTLPVKIRDWWGYGVSTYVGVGKNNVA